MSRILARVGSSSVAYFALNFEVNIIPEELVVAAAASDFDFVFEGAVTAATDAFD